MPYDSKDKKDLVEGNYNMDTILKREKDGTIQGITTMGDTLKKEPISRESSERTKRKDEYEKKWNEKKERIVL